MLKAIRNYRPIKKTLRMTYAFSLPVYTVMDLSYGKEEIKIYAFLTNLFQSGFFQLTQFSKETQLRIFFF